MGSNTLRLQSLISLAIFASALTGVISANVSGENNPQLQRALLAENWSQVIRMLDGLQSPSPIQRLLRGHAYLALNKNNESVCEFLSVSTPNDLRQWHDWSRQFLTQNADAPIAHYFYGDAVARLGRRDAAIEAFSTALARDPQHSLARNARGVAYVVSGLENEAIADFYDAARGATELVDAHANIGSWYLKKSESPDEAVRVFTRALEIAPNFVLALNGRASAATVQDNWDVALPDYELALANSTGCLAPFASMIHANVGTLAAIQSEAVSAFLQRVAKLKPGMTAKVTADMIRGMPEANAAIARSVLVPAVNFATALLKIMPANTKLISQVGLKADATTMGFPIPEAKIFLQSTLATRTDMLQGLGVMHASLNSINTYHPSVQSRPLTLGSLPGAISSVLQKPLFALTPIPGGVSSREVDLAKVDKGEWGRLTMFSLLYSQL